MPWTEIGATLHRIGCHTRAESTSDKTRGQADTLQGMGLPRLPLPQDLKITLSSQVLHILAFHLLQESQAIDCLSGGAL